jgi:hypothetical protein
MRWWPTSEYRCDWISMFWNELYHMGGGVWDKWFLARTIGIEVFWQYLNTVLPSQSNFGRLTERWKVQLCLALNLKNTTSDLESIVDALLCSKHRCLQVHWHGSAPITAMVWRTLEQEYLWSEKVHWKQQWHNKSRHRQHPIEVTVLWSGYGVWRDYSSVLWDMCVRFWTFFWSECGTHTRWNFENLDATKLLQLIWRGACASMRILSEICFRLVGLGYVSPFIVEDGFWWRGVPYRRDANLVMALPVAKWEKYRLVVGTCFE